MVQSVKIIFYVHYLSKQNLSKQIDDSYNLAMSYASYRIIYRKYFLWLP
jgi:hypothetical protein